MQSITPFLWFDTQALDAAKFYTKVFPRSKIVVITRYSEAGPRPKGSVMTVQFKLDGNDFVALNGGPGHPFTQAISLSVACKTQRDVDGLWKKLTKGGAEIACGWLKDKYGLSWQIVPTALPKLMANKDPATAARVARAMFTMKKLDIAALQAAAADRAPAKSNAQKRVKKSAR